MGTSIISMADVLEEVASKDHTGPLRMTRAFQGGGAVELEMNVLLIQPSDLQPNDEEVGVTPHDEQLIDEIL